VRGLAGHADSLVAGLVHLGEVLGDGGVLEDDRPPRQEARSPRASLVWLVVISGLDARVTPAPPDIPAPPKAVLELTDEDDQPLTDEQGETLVADN
jgi:hypothetical protein